MSDAEETTHTFAMEDIAMINRSYQNKYPWVDLQTNKETVKQNPVVILEIPKNTLKLCAEISLSDLFKCYFSEKGFFYISKFFK